MKAIILAFLIAGYSPQGDWQEQFRWSVAQFEKTTTDWYQHPQPRLSRLIETGRGNCVAYGKLAQALAFTHGHKVRCYTLKDIFKNARHRIVIVTDSKGKWMVTNREIVKMKNTRDAVKYFKDPYRVEKKWDATWFDDDADD